MNDLLTPEEAKSYEFLWRAKAGTVDEIFRRQFISSVADHSGLYNRLIAIETQIARLQAVVAAREATNKTAASEAVLTKKAERAAALTAAAAARSRQDYEPDNEYAPIPPHLPVEVIEVEAIPTYADHSLEETIQRRANGLIRWNYFSLGSPRRTSRRYEGFRRG